MGRDHALAHGYDDAPAHAGGHADFPPVPSERWITPAPEDFADAPPMGSLLWPLFWMALAVAIWRILSTTIWTVSHGGP